MAVDSSGNVYVTGASGGDYATVKYDADGNQLWVARYDGPANSGDQAFAMAVDSSGNVHVTGGSPGSGTSSDYATVKYDTNGNELWAARYDGPANSYDGAYAIAVDASGDVYIAGRSYGSGTSSDYATVKYDTNGNEIWVRRHNGPANDFDEAAAVAVDDAGSVYVTGLSDGGATYWDYATMKYDSSGNEVWVATYNGPANDYDDAWAMAVDASGNVYVTGGSEGLDTGYDYATVKYSQQVAPTWPDGSTLAASGVFLVSLTLTWTPAEDEVGVVEYLLFQDEEFIDSVTPEVLSYNVIGLRPFTEYTFKVEACDGEGYCSTDGPTATVTTLTPVGAIWQVIDEVGALNLQQGIDNSLDGKLEAAQQALDDLNQNNDVASISALEAFINAVEAQRGNKIPEADANALIATAQEIIDMLSGV
jgi:hypothetical protein